MVDRDQSYLTGRRQDELTPDDISRVKQAFQALGYSGPLEFRRGHRTTTGVRVVIDEHTRMPTPRIYVGADIMPGADVVNPNQRIDYVAAAAHEITHTIRIENNQEFVEAEFKDIEEAITSLHAACEFRNVLRPSQVEQLVTDAVQRLVNYVLRARQARAEGGER
ncbi:MAG: hypothetical protein R6V85_09200 [Polyangia bacterium]